LIWSYVLICLCLQNYWCDQSIQNLACWFQVMSYCNIFLNLILRFHDNINFAITVWFAFNLPIMFHSYWFTFGHINAGNNEWWPNIYIWENVIKMGNYQFSSTLLNGFDLYSQYTLPLYIVVNLSMLTMILLSHMLWD
jgi:hypothetical protein